MFVTKCVRTPLEDWASDFTCHKLHWELFNISRPTTGIDLCHKHISIVKSVVWYLTPNVGTIRAHKKLHHCK